MFFSDYTRDYFRIMNALGCGNTRQALEAISSVDSYLTEIKRVTRSDTFAEAMEKIRKEFTGW